MARSTPRHWPSTVRFIRSQVYHQSVSTTVRSFIQGVAPLSSGIESNHPSLVVVRPVTASSHPAHGQRGLFASKKIPPHTHIIDYVGEVHCDDRPDSDYDLSLYRSQEVNVGVDASVMGNEARFINDFRGIRDRPNAVFVEGRSPLGELRMSVWSGKDGVDKGEEILVSYGKGWWRWRT